MNPVAHSTTKAGGMMRPSLRSGVVRCIFAPLAPALRVGETPDPTPVHRRAARLAPSGRACHVPARENGRAPPADLLRTALVGLSALRASRRLGDREPYRALDADLDVPLLDPADRARPALRLGSARRRGREPDPRGLAAGGGRTDRR